MTHTGRIILLASLLTLAFCGFAIGQIPATATQLVDQGTKFAVAKQYDMAIEAFQSAIKLDPNLSTAQAGLGAALIGMVRNADAVEPLKLAVTLDPKNVMAFANLGTAYLNLHRFDEALKALGEAAKLRPTDEKLFNLMGGAASDSGKFEEAIAYFKKASELEPRNPAEFFNIGLTYSRMGRFAEAIEPFKTCLTMKPGHAGARLDLGIAYSKTGHYADAVDSFTKFLELVPDERAGLINRCLNYLYLGNSGREAAMDAQKYLKLYGWRTAPSAYQAIVAVIGYREAGMEREAQVALDEAQKNIDPRSWAFNIVRYVAGDITSGDLLKLAANNDQRTEAHAYIGVDLRIKGHADEAKPHFQWVKDYGNGTFVEYTLAIAELGR